VLVLWDVDYTLVNAGGLGTRLYESVFREMFGRELPAVAPKAGRTDRAITADTLTLAGVPAPGAQVDAFLASLARQVIALEGQAGSPVVALPGAAQALAALNVNATARGPGEERVRQSVLTGNIRPLAELKLRAAGLDTGLNFDVGAYGDVHEVRAELVDVARRAAGSAYGADFSGLATVLVGDTPLDVAAALASGARAVGVATGSYSPGQLAAAGAHAVLPDLTDTARVLAAVNGPRRP
jgi:phosphoglycolate phosphatase